MDVCNPRRLTPTPYTRILTTSNRPVSVHRYAENAFSNDYYKFLLDKKWTVKTTHEGKPWKGPKQYEADGGKLMMLPTDMVLLVRILTGRTRRTSLSARAL